MNETEVSLRELVNSLTFVIRKNNFVGARTMGPCHNGCGNSAAGSGLCHDCATYDLGKLVGHETARKYSSAVRSQTQALVQMEEVIEAADNEQRY